MSAVAGATLMKRIYRVIFGVLMAVTAAALLDTTTAEAQGLIGLRASPPDDRTPREAAPVDFTGYWTSYFAEATRYRLFTPPRGDHVGVVLTPAGSALVDSWDPERDAAEGRACQAYGVGNIMRMPVRLRIEWMDDHTLVIETDHGQQRRLLRFDGPHWKPGDARSLQGDSVANWDFNTLSVVSRNMSAGYLRRNGVPHSENAVVTEFFDYRVHPNGDVWFTVTTKVDDPEYLVRPLYTSSDFKKLATGEEWNPSPCVSEWGPRRERAQGQTEAILDRVQ